MVRAASGHEDEIESYRPEITRHCRRILGSDLEAEDATQETMIRAWAALDRFEGRAALRSWLHRIATNVCIDMARAPQRRARPMDLGLCPAIEIEGRTDAAGPDPADVTVSREAVRAALLIAFRLPDLPCAVLILRGVLRWSAKDVAELLDTTTQSVNSALQRARAALASADVDRTAFRTAERTGHDELLQMCLDALEHDDARGLTAHLVRYVRSARRNGGFAHGPPPDVAA